MDNREIADLHRRIERELLDSYDEELELELDDQRFDEIGSGEAPPESADERAKRRRYFTELLRLQGELVKLQDWVATTRHRVVILFEGRDAAGKGGVIKRITSASTRACAGWLRCLRPTTASARSGTSSAMRRTCRQPARWCCSTAAGTTAPASSG